MATIYLERNTGDKVVRVDQYTGPANWREMNKQHLILWASAMCSSVRSLDAMIILAGMLYKINLEVLCKVIKRKDQVRLARSISFLLKKNQLTAWLIPCFWFKFKKYHGPKDKLSNLTAEEFGLCELCYEHFELTRDKGYLDALVAILYRPRRWKNIDDDIRVPLTSYAREKRTERFKQLPDRIRWSVYLNYEGCRNFIIASHREVFKKSSPGAPSKPTSWAKVVQSAAGGIFGTLKETEKSNIHKFLSELNDRLKEMADNTKP